MSLLTLKNVRPLQICNYSNQAVPLSIKESKVDPNSFRGVYTKHGWFLVPRSHYNPRWIIDKIEKRLDEKYEPNANTYELQNKVDELIGAISKKDVPKRVKQTKQEREAIESDSLYVKQLKDEGEQELDIEDITKVRTIRRRNTNGNPTYTHAWNYYYTSNNSKYPHLPPKEVRRKVGADWSELPQSSRRQWLDDYIALIESGFDIHREYLVVMKAQKDLRYAKKMKAQADKK
ncbi:hypothetical protein QCA50_016480 [Cerrena zonata]|uniref:HMG box domain-containing protein n=1 Tax=Cerrena zonata TaxID=2478898 RepID=A0AAW0FIQ3_9APHY